MDKAKLLGKRYDTTSGMPEGTVEVPGFGTARVRGLSRGETLEAQAAQGLGRFERVLLSRGLVEPTMTEEEIKTWQRVALAGEIRPVVDKIVELSAIKDGAGKEAYKSPPQ